MQLALAYNTKNNLVLTKQTLPVLRDGHHALFWSDGSTELDALNYFENERDIATRSYAGVRGGADAGIVHSLTRLLEYPEYTHIGLVEADVLLDEDWFRSTLDLFKKGEAAGLHVGAVSARTYVDRILLQRDGYAVLHNAGAGMIIFTREAAEIVLRSFRTPYWPANRILFAQLSGIDLATYAAFGGREQFLCSDWGFEAQLARHGLATLGLTPVKCNMIGQIPALHEQGLELAQGEIELRRNNEAFKLYARNLDLIREGAFEITEPGIIHRLQGGQLFFPAQMGYLPGSRYSGDWKLKWSQGFGVFSFRVGTEGASLFVPVSGSCSFLVSGGENGATVSITDTRSGFKIDPQLPPEQGSFIEVNVPGGPVPREIILKANEGAVFYGLQTIDPQMIDTTFKFDWSILPEV